MNAYAEALRADAQAQDLRNRTGEYGVTEVILAALPPAVAPTSASDIVRMVREATCQSCYRTAHHIRESGHGRGCYFAEGGAL